MFNVVTHATTATDPRLVSAMHGIPPCTIQLSWCLNYKLTINFEGGTGTRSRLHSALIQFPASSWVFVATLAFVTEHLATIRPTATESLAAGMLA